MNWLKSIQKRARLLMAVLMVLIALVTMVGFLVGVPAGTLRGSLVGGLVGGLVSLVMARAMDWAIARDIARLAALEKEENNGPGLILPPGTWLRNVLHIIYPPKTAERIFDQIIADMQLEWQEAMIHEKKLLARWVRVRGVLTVLLTAVVHVVATLGSILKLVRLG